eukprot:CAMPEP_0181296026 /NCGR_PEP_ID=MMETSP1101-20121128/4471_1 /TAXON_ID=46948 /ORGANISM="Rhodomonas abbreviata, Strain Caron Lab Isolate" /LENGTH=49 /DNA_ID=CAMNT_0023400837 /DNA_START=15 /DNA_END=164 /DNA_ORIENTATION=-
MIAQMLNKKAMPVIDPSKSICPVCRSLSTFRYMYLEKASKGSKTPGVAK